MFRTNSRYKNKHGLHIFIPPRWGSSVKILREEDLQGDQASSEFSESESLMHKCEESPEFSDSESSTPSYRPCTWSSLFLYCFERDDEDEDSPLLSKSQTKLK